jgi:diadenylate cyclase
VVSKGFFGLETVLNYLHRVSTYNHLVVGIELILIGLVVYWAVNFLEGTRGERLFHGVIFILIAGSLILNLVVERFGFERLEYLYKGFMITVMIIAVTGFQPEIRRALMRIGQSPFLSKSKQHLGRTLEEIIRAVEQMSQTRTGAIIVIERQVMLGEFVENGIALDSVVTAELLKTIFYPGSPLHDMAVVIRDDRLIAARVQLPLAEAGSVGGRELGSRHRAGVGLTSGSDAVCIIVSEETGTISVAVNGTLTRNLTGSRLRDRIFETFKTQAQSTENKKAVA